MRGYISGALSEDELDERLEFHPFTHLSQEHSSSIIRGNAKNLARVISQNCPASRELSLALTKIEEAVFWANAAVARIIKEEEE